MHQSVQAKGCRCVHMHAWHETNLVLQIQVLTLALPRLRPSPSLCHGKNAIPKCLQVRE